MGVYGREDESRACFICGNPDSATIEFDRPVILLCECDGCGRFILKYGTRKVLMEDRSTDGAVRCSRGAAELRL